MKILIVDDADDTREAMLYIFRKRGFMVEAARNEREALMVMKQKPDIIIFNSLMSEIYGFETGRQLRESPQTQDTPIIFLSSAGRLEGVIRRPSGATIEYIEKPCDINYLIKESNKLVAEQKKYREMHFSN